MRRRRRCFRGRGLAAIGLIALAACAGPVGERPWIEVRSRNFSIFTALRESDARELLESLELFRAAILVMTRVEDAIPRIPTEIYAFGGASEYAAFRPDSDVTGFFVPGLRSNWVALEAGRRDMQARAILYHEYTHFLLHNEGRTRVPIWFDEGFAELLGAVDVRESMLRVGVLPPHRHLSLVAGPRLSWSRLLRARSVDELSSQEAYAFYTQSWLLVHYLTLGNLDTASSFTARLDRYVARLDAGAAEEPAFHEAFGIEVANLDARLAQYTKKLPMYGLPRAKLAPEIEIGVRPVSRDEIDTRLGWLAMHTGKPALAQRYFERATAANPNGARAFAGMGDVHKMEHRWSEAEAAYRRSIELAPDDWQNQLEYAEYFMQRAMAEEPDRAERLASARQHFARAIELAPENPEAHAMLGVTYTVAGEPPEPGIASLERAAELLPSHAGIDYPLAHLYSRVGQRERAIELLRGVVNHPHAKRNEEAMKLLEEWESGARQELR